jgi:glycosyltransferase involved in cell wall biosynthesis
MASLPLVSVLTPTMNRAATFLPDTIRWVQAQRERGFTHEHVIVDNASSDETEAVVRGFMETDPRIVYVRSETNVFASGALNLAFAHSRGEIVVPLDDDDLLPPDSLQRRFDALQDAEADWVVGLAMFIDGKNALLPARFQHTDYMDTLRKLLDADGRSGDAQELLVGILAHWTLCNGAVTVRRRCIEEVGGWDGSFTCMQDVEMWTKLAAKGFRLQALQDLMVFYRVHAGQESSKNSKNGKWNELGARLRERYGVGKSQA